MRLGLLQQLQIQIQTCRVFDIILAKMLPDNHKSRVCPHNFENLTCLIAKLGIAEAIAAFFWILPFETYSEFQGGLNQK